jgi:diphthamide biosynthesis protein 3
MADDDEQISIYDEVEIEDMTFDETTQLYHYPCPCGDRFEIALVDLMDEADIAVCPSCSLMIRVIFEVDNLPKPKEAPVVVVPQEEAKQVVIAA